MRGMILAALLLILVACQAREDASFIGPSGAEISTVRCTSAPNQCFQQASAKCGGPYQVVDSYSNAGGLVADIMAGPVTWYTMSFQCGPSDGRMPNFPFRGQDYSPPPVVVAPAPAPTVRTPTTTTCTRAWGTLHCSTY